MGGQIRFESELGKGSVFSFNLELDVSPLPQTERLPLDRILGKRVWLLEPDPFTHASLLALLAEWQLDVQSLTMTDDWPEMGSQDMVIIGSSTLHTPQQVITRLDGLSGQQNTIVLLSSHEPALYDAMLAHGAAHCLSKPINHRKLLHALLSPEAARRTPLPAPTPHRVQAVKVLAVDDNAANLKLIAAMLKEMVTEVVVCKNGKEAVNLAQSQPFDIIFMDIQMPVMDGISATQAIRHHSLNTETPIVAVTAHAIPGERERLIRQGMDDYLAKPIDEGMLAQLITDFAHRRHQNQGDQQIDWTLAVRQAAGKPELAKEMLTMLLASFDEVEPMLDEALAGGVEDAEVLAQLHRLNGGCAYSGVPGLQRLLSQLEQQLRDGVPVSELEPELLELQDALEQVRREAPRYLSLAE
ncbi:Signal transduction histidine-protein kinase BarA [compost metagenome]